jgi:AcrR family transcriptional regulator
MFFRQNFSFLTGPVECNKMNILDHSIKVSVAGGLVSKVGMELTRREQILNAALESIAQRSLEGTRMRHIAEAAGVSQPSLHYYFDNKDALIVALLDRLLAEFRATREQGLAAASSPEGKLRVFLEQQKEFLLKSPKTLEVYYDFWVQATKRPSVREKMKRMQTHWRSVIGAVLDEGVRQRAFSSARSEVAPALIVSLLHGAALQYIIEPESFDLDAYFEEVERWLARLITDGDEAVDAV